MVLFAPVTWAVKSERAEVPLGDLMCRLEQVSGSGSEDSSQKRRIACAYQRSSTGNLEFYGGTLSIVGSDSRLKNNRVLSWVVRGPSASDTQPGSLEQSYSDKSDGEAISLAGDKRPSINLIEALK